MPAPRSTTPLTYTQFTHTLSPNNEQHDMRVAPRRCADTFLLCLRYCCVIASFAYVITTEPSSVDDMHATLCPLSLRRAHKARNIVHTFACGSHHDLCSGGGVILLWRTEILRVDRRQDGLEKNRGNQMLNAMAVTLRLAVWSINI